METNKSYQSDAENWGKFYGEEAGKASGGKPTLDEDELTEKSILVADEMVKVFVSQRGIVMADGFQAMWKGYFSASYRQAYARMAIVRPPTPLFSDIESLIPALEGGVYDPQNLVALEENDYDSNLVIIRDTQTKKRLLVADAGILATDLLRLIYTIPTEE